MLSFTRNMRVLAGSSCFGLVLACNQLLNIDEATYDARLSGGDSNAGNGGSTSGQAGSLTGAGSSGVLDTGGTSGSTHQHGGPDAGGTVGSAGDDDPGSSARAGTNSGNQAGNAGTGHGHDPSEGGSDGEGEGGNAGADDGPEDPCETYCNEMDAQCQGAAVQYIDKNQCLRVCALFPPGTSNGPDENSVACRMKYAKKAHYALGSEVTAYCHQAGPSGEGRCGNVCQAFCSLMVSVCTAETAGAYHFASNEECLTTCEALPPASVSYSSSDPLVADGNHALCRLFHVTSAAMADPEEHCEHALGVTLCEAPAL